ncbi:MAG: alkylhydroperoxidase/carboxymuconolactone decarboxylase family protein YurZ [Myxococcota bacterium]|jgi:alkylhydroperoxidase/carboxymuconolactone decarboxylase family protein YurZ
MSDVRDILDADALGRLKAHYSSELMTKVATTMAWQPYPPAEGLIGAVGERFYESTAQMCGRDREMCLITILASGGFPPFALAVHIYWGLMEGLSVDQIADVLTLTGTYCGIPRMTDGYFTLGETLKLLNEASKKPITAASGQVLGLVVAAFR